MQEASAQPVLLAGPDKSLLHPDDGPQNLNSAKFPKLWQRLHQPGLRPGSAPKAAFYSPYNAYRQTLMEKQSLLQPSSVASQPTKCFKMRFKRPLPSSVDHWNVTEVSDWVAAFGFPQYKRQFIHQDVTGSLLLKLSHARLKVDLGIAVLAHREALLDAIKELATTLTTERADCSRTAALLSPPTLKAQAHRQRLLKQLQRARHHFASLNSKLEGTSRQTNLVAEDIIHLKGVIKADFANSNLGLDRQGAIPWHPNGTPFEQTVPWVERAVADRATDKCVKTPAYLQSHQSDAVPFLDRMTRDLEGRSRRLEEKRKFLQSPETVFQDPNFTQNVRQANLSLVKRHVYATLGVEISDLQQGKICLDSILHAGFQVRGSTKQPSQLEEMIKCMNSSVQTANINSELSPSRWRVRSEDTYLHSGNFNKAAQEANLRHESTSENHSLDQSQACGEQPEMEEQSQRNTELAVTAEFSKSLEVDSQNLRDYTSTLHNEPAALSAKSLASVLPAHQCMNVNGSVEIATSGGTSAAEENDSPCARKNDRTTLFSNELQACILEECTTSGSLKDESLLKCVSLSEIMDFLVSELPGRLGFTATKGKAVLRASSENDKLRQLSSLIRGVNFMERYENDIRVREERKLGLIKQGQQAEKSMAKVQPRMHTQVKPEMPPSQLDDIDLERCQLLFARAGWQPSNFLLRSGEEADSKLNLVLARAKFAALSRQKKLGAASLEPDPCDELDELQASYIKLHSMCDDEGASEEGNTRASNILPTSDAAELALRFGRIPTHKAIFQSITTTASSEHQPNSTSGVNKSRHAHHKLFSSTNDRSKRSRSEIEEKSVMSGEENEHEKTKASMQRALQGGCSIKDVLKQVVEQLSRCRVDEIGRLQKLTGQKKHVCLYRTLVTQRFLHDIELDNKRRAEKAEAALIAFQRPTKRLTKEEATAFYARLVADGERRRKTRHDAVKAAQELEVSAMAKGRMALVEALQAKVKDEKGEQVVEAGSPQSAAPSSAAARAPKFQRPASAAALTTI